MRKQLDSRWRQLDKFEASLKTLAEAKGLWRKKLAAKEGEVEALKVRARQSERRFVGLTVRTPDNEQRAAVCD